MLNSSVQRGMFHVMSDEQDHTGGPGSVDTFTACPEVTELRVLISDTSNTKWPDLSQ